MSRGGRTLSETAEGAERTAQPAPDMRSEGLWRRGGGEWRVAVLRRRRSGACRRAPALSPRPCPSRPRPRVAPRRALRHRVSLLRDLHLPTHVVTYTLRHPSLADTYDTCRARDCKMRCKPAKLGCEVRREERHFAFLTISHPDKQTTRSLICQNLLLTLSRITQSTILLLLQSGVSIIIHFLNYL